MVKGYHCFFTILWTLILLLTGCSSEVPTASLWTDGAWILYDIQRIDTDGDKISGTLKVSSVGNEFIDGNPYHWIEMREDSQKGVTIKKFLAKEKENFNPRESFIFWDDVQKIIIQTNSETPESIPAQHLKRFAPTFIQSAKANRFGNAENVSPAEFKELPEKNFSLNGSDVSSKGYHISRHTKSSINLGFLNLEDTTKATTEYYISPNIPFGGIVSVKHESTITSINKTKPDQEPKPPVFWETRLTAKQYGMNGAKTQIIGEPIEKQVLPFPFLKGDSK